MHLSLEIGKKTCCKSFVYFLISFKILRNFCWFWSITWLWYLWCYHWICNHSGLDFSRSVRGILHDIRMHLLINAKDFGGNFNGNSHLRIYWNRFWLTQVRFQIDGATLWVRKFRYGSLWVRKFQKSVWNPISARSNIEMELAEIPNRSISVDSDSDSYF